MAITVQNVTATRTYTPIEGMSERMRMANAVPRGIIRFVTTSALTAKAINDDFNLSITCSLPVNYAYVFSNMAFSISVDTATDFNATARLRIFNGIPNGPPGNTQNCVFNMLNYSNEGTNDPFRIADFTNGDLRSYMPGVLYAPAGATNQSFIISYDNGADPAMAAGSISFALSCYQYELNQAVRFPLNFPIPVGVR